MKDFKEFLGEENLDEATFDELDKLRNNVEKSITALVKAYTKAGQGGMISAAVGESLQNTVPKSSLKFMAKYTK